MKRRVFFPLPVAALAVLSMAVVAGCQMFGGDAERPLGIDELPTERRIGIIKSLGGVKTSSQGTHLLELDNGDTILLKSLAINLDDPQYAKMTVEVRGALLYTTDGKQIMEVMSIDILEEAITQEIAVPGWKDYVSTAMGFSIKYRDDLAVSTKDGVAFERNVEEAGHDGSVMAAKHAMTIEAEKIVENKTLAETLSIAGMNKSRIGAQSLDAFKKTEDVTVTYFIPTTEWFYTITIDTGNDDKTLDDQNLFYEMLSTFRLLDSDEYDVKEVDVLNNLDIIENRKPAMTSPTREDLTQADETKSPTPKAEAVEISDYSLLESETFKFTLQYPKNWYYAGSASSETDVIRHYDFGAKPLDDEPAIVGFDVMSGVIPTGTTVTVGGKTVIKVTSGGKVYIYVQGEGSRYYRLSGPSVYESTLLQMATVAVDKS